MSAGARLAVVGATGAVGRTMLRVLEERSFPVGELRLMASSRSAGRTVATPWGEVVVEDLAEADPTGVEIALFSAGGARSREHAPRFVEAGAIVVDNSSAFRMDSDVPLVVAGVNDEAILGNRGIVANPNCTTMALMMAVGPLHRAAGLGWLIASSYQAVSGTGQAAVDALLREVAELATRPEALVDGGWEDPGSGEIYPKPIGFNVIPFAGSEADEGYTDEEWKLVNETRKILDAPDVRIEATCVRVPTVVGHGISASVWFRRPMGVDEARELVAAAPGVRLADDGIPTPLDSAGVDDVLVGRIRRTLGEEGGLNLWVVGDNLRKGAATNAVQLAELLLDHR